jgi:RNA-directed DNA polymerase
MHYAFDTWMQRNYFHIPFERYADDAVVHCKSGEEASRLKDAIGARLMDCGLELHPDKTKIVYCQDGQRKGNYSNVKFDFLGYGFQPRQSKARWGISFLISVQLSVLRLRNRYVKPFGVGKSTGGHIYPSKS